MSAPPPPISPAASAAGAADVTNVADAAEAIDAAHAPLHGGPDAQGQPAHDLSSNSHPCGPCPAAAQAVAAARPAAYPDPASAALRQRLARWHGVHPRRILIAASGSEFIQRISSAIAIQAHTRAAAPPRVWLPPHAYGDYARAARAHGLAPAAHPAQAALLWACEPSSPLGQPQSDLPALAAALQAQQTLVLDLAYAPLRLHGQPSLTPAQLDALWQLIIPNKAMGLTGVRAAYVIAPAAALEAAHPAAALHARLHALAPSWPLGAHGEALLHAWASPAAAAWLQAQQPTLRQWHARFAHALQTAGWRPRPSQTPFVTARPPAHLGPPAHWLPALRQRGFKLRDCTSFALPGHLRINTPHPQVQDALLHALNSL